LEQAGALYYRLYKLPKAQKNKPWKFKHLTVEHVYEPLAKSNGKIFLPKRCVRPAMRDGKDFINFYRRSV
jgi:hypothetical protein